MANVFPNTEMEVIEKYPLSRRLDHPNFGEVCKTTFGKGIITDFEKVSEVPLQVKSKVKVQGDWGESDFIPLFFHPKKQYWDYWDFESTSFLATDYNQEGGYFEKAWMSFRGDDEVAVMLKEGVPVAVVGFADGTPRIGEDVLKSGYVNKHWSVNQQLLYIGGDLGPDGKQLGLLLPCQRIHQKTESNTLVEDSSPNGKWSTTIVTQCYLYLAIISPFLYFITQTSMAVGPRWYEGPMPPGWEPSFPPDGYSTGLTGVWKAVYSNEVYNRAKAMTEYPASDDPDFQAAFLYDLMVLDLTFPGVPDADFQFMVRPHTKTELQNAGMWPT